MKRSMLLTLTLACVAILAAAQSSEPLGDVARRERERRAQSKTKPKMPAGSEDAAAPSSPSAPAAKERASNPSPMAVRETSKGSSPVSAVVAEIQSLSEPEQHAFAHVLFLSLAEEGCKSLVGHYASLDQILDTGCKKGSAAVPAMAQGDDPRALKQYLPKIEITDTKVKVSMQPRTADLAGFLFDGDVIRYQRKGQASGSSRSLGPPADLFKEKP